METTTASGRCALALTLAGLWLAATAAHAGAAATRPSTASGSAGGGVSHASGHATYGYGGHHAHAGYPYGGHYGYYGYWGYPGPWGSAYWGPWYYPYPSVVVPIAAPRDAPAAVETVVKPKRAEVWVDGERVGQARDFSGRWDRLWVAPGARSIELRHAGYRTLRIALDLAPSGYVRIAETLEKGAGQDARSTEHPPAQEPPRETAAAAVQLRRGLLRLDVAPPDAAVYLDGEFLARADELARLHGAIPVAEGPHRLEVVRPGFLADTREVDVTGTEPVRVRIELEPGTAP